MKTHKGLTLVGSIVAVAILGTSLAAFINYQAFLTRANIQKKYATVGAFLASEGVEVARGIRDSNYKEIRSGTTLDWNAGLADGTYTFDAETMDLTTGFATPANCPTNCQLGQGSSGQYVLGGDPVGATITRYVEISSATAPLGVPGQVDEINVRSVILVQDRGYQAQYESTTILYNTDRL